MVAQRHKHAALSQIPRASCVAFSQDPSGRSSYLFRSYDLNQLVFKHSQTERRKYSVQRLGLFQAVDQPYLGQHWAEQHSENCRRRD